MSQVREASEESQRNLSWLILLCLLILPPSCEGFLPNFWSQMVTLSWDSHTHQYITERAILNVTVEVLRATTKHQVEGKVGFQNAPFFCKTFNETFRRLITKPTDFSFVPRPDLAAAFGEP